MDYYQAPRWTSEIADCSMPMTFDQYSNCSYGCLYCFSTFQRAVGDGKENYLAKRVKPVKIESVVKHFCDPEKSQFGPFIRMGKTMQWGSLSDPFCNFEKKYGVGLELLRFFKAINYPLCLSTKGVWWLDDPRYTELFKGQKNWNVKVSIIMTNEDFVKKIEPGVPTTKERLKALEKITALNCGGATLRLRPFIIGITNHNNGHIELIKESGKRGAGAVSTEFFCCERRSMILRERLKIMSECAGFDVWKYYVKNSYNQGYMRLNRNTKRPYVDEMQKAAREAGMRFYVSDAHFKERCDNGSCCGLPADWPGSYSKGQWCEALMIAKKRGYVTWDDIDPHLAYADTFLWRLNIGMNRGSAEKAASFVNHTCKDYMRWLWNNPNAGQSPYYMYEGILKPRPDADANGNLIYDYDSSKA